VPGWCGCVVHDWANEKANSDSYPVKVGGMMLRGVHGILMAPGELVCHLYHDPKENFQAGAGIARGLGNGLIWTMDGAVRGAWDILSSPFPDYHGEPTTHVNECWGGEPAASK